MDTAIKNLLRCRGSMTIRFGETRTYEVLPCPDRIRCEHTGFRMIDSTAWSRPKAPVKTKQDFYRRFYNGEFGNHGPMWQDLAGWQEAGSPAPVMIRCRVPDGTNFTRVPRCQVAKKFKIAQLSGHLPTINLQCPEHDKILTGEVCLSHRGLEFAGSEDPATDQRRSTRLLSGTVRLHGLQAHLLLKGKMDGASWDWLNYLLDAYRDHVVEFTTFRYPWGVVPGMNTVWWEVRGAY